MTQGPVQAPLGSTRGLPLSRAYWDLKAEQVLNRVFASEAAIDVEVMEAPPPPVATQAPAPPAGSAAANGGGAGPRRTTTPPPPPPAPSPAVGYGSSRRAPRGQVGWLGQQRAVVLAGVGVVGLLTTAASLVLLGLWNQNQQVLRQERNLLLLERLRELGPDATAAAAMPARDANPPGSAETATTAPGAEGLPPPPPDEPWMQELAALPSEGAPRAEVLKVPASRQITSPAPAASAGSGSAGGSSGSSSSAGSTGAAASAAASGAAMPQLVGVVQIPGRSGSAIFQTGGSSTSAGVGELIGSSGWRLRSATGDSAVIERGGEQRRLSISSGF